MPGTIVILAGPPVLEGFEGQWIYYNQRWMRIIFISTSRQTHLQIQYNILTNRKSLCNVKYCCGEERKFPHPLIKYETIFTRNTEVTEGKYKCQI